MWSGMMISESSFSLTVAGGGSWRIQAGRVNQYNSCVEGCRGLPGIARGQDGRRRLAEDGRWGMWRKEIENAPPRRAGLDSQCQ